MLSTRCGFRSVIDRIIAFLARLKSSTYACRALNGLQTLSAFPFVTSAGGQK